MLKKLLVITLFISLWTLVACDVQYKKCVYEVYQMGELLPTKCVHFHYRLSEKCMDHSKDGSFYKLIDTQMVKAKHIKL